MIERRITLLEEILGERQNELGKDYLGYKNHVYRMIHFCFAQHDFDSEEREKIIIAGCFHDIGIWTGDTFDYLPPSIKSANEYLVQNGLEKWLPEIGSMIDQHHKLRSSTDANGGLVDIFRKGDLVDFSLGLIRCGVPGAYIREVKAMYPNAKFHKQILRLAGRWVCRHPLNPIPVLKW